MSHFVSNISVHVAKTSELAVEISAFPCLPNAVHLQETFSTIHFHPTYQSDYNYPL